MNSESQTTDAEHAAKCQLAVDVLGSSRKLHLHVNGWSMLPSLWPGDTVLVVHVGSDEVIARVVAGVYGLVQSRQVQAVQVQSA